MIRLTAECCLQSGLAGDTIHNAHWKIQAVEHGTLLDMKLDVTERAAPELGLLQTVRVQTEITNCLSHRDSAGILALQYAVIQCARDCLAAEKRHAEPNAFFFGKCQHLDAEAGH